jgi:exosortase/archaeosortase family protein
MPAAHALILLIAAFWEGWWLLIDRFGDSFAAFPLVVLLLVVAFPAIKAIRAGTAPPVPASLLCAALGAYIGFAWFGIVLIQIAIAVIALLIVTYHSASGQTPSAPLFGVGLLLLPVLPSFEFYLAYPLRVICAVLSAGLLRMNGISVDVEGVVLHWQGKPLMFDAACAGVHMLWTALVLTSAIALIGRFSLLRYGGAVMIAVAITIFGNALRAASLFYLENGFIASMSGAFYHEVIGVMAFGLLAVAIVLAIAPRQWRMK